MDIIEARSAIIRLAQNPEDGIPVQPCKESNCGKLNAKIGCADEMGPMLEGNSVVCPLQRGVIYVAETSMQAK